MRIINSITDIRRIVDGWSGSGYWTNDPAAHSEAVNKIARVIADQAHEAGLRYGEDWSAWLEQYSNAECCAILEEEPDV